MTGDLLCVYIVCTITVCVCVCTSAHNTYIYTLCVCICVHYTYVLYNGKCWREKTLANSAVYIIWKRNLW